MLRRVVQWRAGVQWCLVALLANLVSWLLAYSAVLGPGLLAPALKVKTSRRHRSRSAQA